ncbi:MAG: SAM-dependent methyltransferase [Sporichthyaceae bacterium]
MSEPLGRPVPWREATEQALYGDGGFYRRTGGPAAHFRTSVHASPLFAEALLRMASATGLRTVVDVGSGRGELLAQLHEWDPALRLVGVDVVDRPGDLPAAVEWSSTVPEVDSALLVANEWLDNVPVDVAVRTADGDRLVLVDLATGTETPGGPLSARDAAWLEQWWALTEDGQRAEIGWPRDAAWSRVLDRLGSGIAIAVDYAHAAADRPPLGTLTGYRDGRQVPPVPDASCDVTAHVALDACAEAGRRAGATTTVLTTQRDALTALGMVAEQPHSELASTDANAYVAAIVRVGQLAELRERGGLGDFGWLIQALETPLPAALLGEQRQL